MELSSGMKGVVVGLGKSGLAAVKYLNGLGIEVGVSERRNINELSAEENAVLEENALYVETGGHSDEFCTSADVVVVSPGIPLELPALRAAQSCGIPVVGELAMAADDFKVPVIAVTGSNGKTTVTSLIAHILEAAGKNVFLGGNIGTPVLEHIMNPGDCEVAVLELSSFQLQSAGDFRPDIGLLLNLSPDHLDWHGSMQAYAEAKWKMFVHQSEEDIAIIGGDDRYVQQQSFVAPGQVYQFGTGPDCRAIIDDFSVKILPGFREKKNEEQYDLQGTQLESRVNMFNAAAALLASRIFGCSYQDVSAGLGSFQPPEHRMTPVGKVNGIRFVNDSKATNVGAVVAALSGFSKNVVLISGGRDKGSDFSALRSVVQERVKHVILIGEAQQVIARALAGAVEMEHAKSMEAAVAMAYDQADDNDTVLLAPACASFDMFDNYGERGRVFTSCVESLRQKLSRG